MLQPLLVVWVFFLATSWVAIGQANNDDLPAPEPKAEQCQSVHVRPLKRSENEFVAVIDNFMNGDVLVHDVYRHLASVSSTTAKHDVWRMQSPLHRDELAQQHFHKSGAVSGEDTLFHPRQPDPTGGFPGMIADLTQTYRDAFLQALRPYQGQLVELFGDGVITTNASMTITPFSFFGNVCFHPDSLLPIQSIPHVDRGYNNRGTHQYDSLSLALVHYIHPNYKGRGGTAFYKEKLTNSSRFNTQDCQRLMQTSGKTFQPQSKDHLWHASCHCLWPSLQSACRGRVDFVGRQQGYGSDIAEHYELLEHAPYAFNRLVVYDPNQLHAAYVDQDVKSFLSCKPEYGRLTANLFLKV